MSESNIEDTNSSELPPSVHACKTVSAEELAASTHPKAPEVPLRVPPEEIIEEEKEIEEAEAETAEEETIQEIEKEKEKPAKSAAKKK